MAFTTPGPDPSCNCLPCQKRREAQKRFYLKKKTDPKYQKKLKEKNKKRQRSLGPDLKI